VCACVCFSDVPKVPYCPESGQCSSGDDFAHLEQRAGCAWSGSYLEHSSNSPREWPANKCCTPEALGRVLRLRDSPRLLFSTVPLSAATCKHQHRPGLRWSWSILPALPPTEVAMTASPAKPRALTWYCRLTLTRLGIRFSFRLHTPESMPQSITACTGQPGSLHCRWKIKFPHTPRSPHPRSSRPAKSRRDAATWAGSPLL
jgi:hypothetical protein